ncbi:MAG: hypothetical protein ABII74_01670 [Elusimicrobiota bacterium]
MKKKLIQIIKEIINLLVDCNWQDKANWFKEKLEQIEQCDEKSDQYISILDEVQNIIAGMGSFTDLPMTPDKKSRLSEEQVHKKQWELANALDEIIIKIKGK